ncbi:TlpA family protein disulfide reductase [Flagellimonas meishanensis]|uniref:TlpA family protein disulfide reductase n=1 Tax=Flagellimonas meishanensis TaxID=2873264 RepID=UPI00223B150F|nr:hypothetical protein [[Muricauda] meishanensis]
MEKKGYNLPIYFQMTKAPNQFEHSSIPTTYILGKSGRIVVDESGAANWNSSATRMLLDSLLRE